MSNLFEKLPSELNSLISYYCQLKEFRQLYLAYSPIFQTKWESLTYWRQRAMHRYQLSVLEYHLPINTNTKNTTSDTSKNTTLEIHSKDRLWKEYQQSITSHGFVEEGFECKTLECLELRNSYYEFLKTPFTFRNWNKPSYFKSNRYYETIIDKVLYQKMFVDSKTLTQLVHNAIRSQEFLMFKYTLTLLIKTYYLNLLSIDDKIEELAKILRLLGKYRKSNPKFFMRSYQLLSANYPSYRAHHRYGLHEKLRHLKILIDDDLEKYKNCDRLRHTRYDYIQEFTEDWCICLEVGAINIGSFVNDKIMNQDHILPIEFDYGLGPRPSCIHYDSIPLLKKINDFYLKLLDMHSSDRYYSGGYYCFLTDIIFILSDQMYDDQVYLHKISMNLQNDHYKLEDFYYNWLDTHCKIHTLNDIRIFVRSTQTETMYNRLMKIFDQYYPGNKWKKCWLKPEYQLEQLEKKYSPCDEIKKQRSIRVVKDIIHNISNNL